MLRTTSTFAWLCFAFYGSLTQARDDAGFRHTIFNGANLDGWNVTGCDAQVTNGSLLLQDGNGFVRTNHAYTDFILEIEWRPLREEKWDSGIYIRAALPSENEHWPQQYQINLLQGHEGNLIGQPLAANPDLVKPGDWNHFKLTVIGPHAELEINGHFAWETNSLEALSGYIGLQSEVPGGGQFLFRNIAITELHHQSLFNGTDLTGWEGAGQDAALCWKAAGGELLCTGDQGPWLRSLAEYDDFNLRLEYRLRDGGNSGVYLRVPADGNHHGEGAGVEVQILDDKSTRYKDLKPYQFSGSVYAIAPARQHVGLPVGHWNTLEIHCTAKNYVVTHNGIVIVAAQTAEFPELMERRSKGFLGLQNHSEEVWFRNLRLATQ
ncbi:MAG: DUF1080 domain-containing protein [Pirellulaceae bacterium]|nr:DUF1080 domain-containing protein [Pirellulaceae bacterium]